MQPEPIMTDSSADAKDRASERRNFMLMTALTCATHGAMNAKVRNLSAGGMMVELPEEPQPEFERGQKINAELRNIGRIKGEVAWVEGRRFGIKFEREIDPELARKPVSVGYETPDFIKPVLVPSRSLKYVEGLKGW